MHALLYSVPQPCSRPPPTHTTTGDSWTLTGKSGSVSCGVTAFSWVLVNTSFCLCPPRVGFLVLCKFWQLYGGVNDDLLQGGLLPYPGLLHPEPLPLWKATADPYLLRRHPNTVLAQSLGPGVHKVIFEPSEHLWWVWGLILNAISPLLPSFWGFSFALGRGVSFFGGIQHSPVDGCSAAICKFGVLTGEDECLSFYSAIL